MNHDILLKKIHLYGVRGLPLSWIRSYLKDRQSFIKLGTATSENKTINIGIPQGSIIGPLLFLIFINDLPNVSNMFQTCLFAHDTTLSAKDKDFSVLIQNTNIELEKIQDWTISNRLSINVDKTELIIFSNRRHGIDTLTNLANLNGDVLEYSDSCKFLGVFIDKDLTFVQHINDIVGKLSRGTGILYNIRSKLSVEARINYYHGMLYPYI